MKYLDRTSATIIVLILAFILFILCLAVTADPDLRVAKCKQAGGIWVENLRTTGKTVTADQLGCFKPDAFIPIE